MCLATVFYKTGFISILYRFKTKYWGPNILYYHRVCEDGEECISSSEITVSKETFEKQIGFLKNSFNILPLDVIVDQMENGIIPSLDDIAITFDDGYIDNYKQAYPILKKYGVPATIFVTTGYVGSSKLFWWDKVYQMVNIIKNRLVDWESMPSDLFPDEFKALLRKNLKRRISFNAITDYLKRVGTTKRDEIITYLENEFFPSKNHEANSRLFLSWEEMKEMHNNGITFGSHTHTHPVLTEMSDEEVTQELTISKRLIREGIGAEVKAFSYPDGWFDGRVKQLVIKAGYECAFQTSRVKSTNSQDLFEIPRKMVKEGHSRGYFKLFSPALFQMELYRIFDCLFVRKKRRRNPYVQ